MQVITNVRLVKEVRKCDICVCQLAYGSINSLEDARPWQGLMPVPALPLPPRHLLLQLMGGHVHEASASTDD